MCGITGLLKFNESDFDGSKLFLGWETMFSTSLRRGSDSSGLIAITSDRGASLKCSGSANTLLKLDAYQTLKQSLDTKSIRLLMGHSRLATNGTSKLSQNNQPVIYGDLALLHNGIVVNENALRQEFGIASQTELDSDLIAQLLLLFGIRENPDRALRELFSRIRGNTTLAITLGESGKCFIATNNGSMYTLHDVKMGIFLFASEPSFLEKGAGALGLHKVTHLITQLKPDCYLEISTDSLAISDIPSISLIGNIALEPIFSLTHENTFLTYKDFSTPELPDFYRLERCSSCILPITFPGIQFNSQGECTFCSGDAPLPKEILGIEKLLFDLGVSKENYNRNPIVVGVSGGRDSCYGLHFLVRVLGLNVIAYTYDWGMVTDLARRNIAKMCGDLGIEHVIIAPDISVKLRNIRLNLLAWMRNPDLGLVPLMMAGDKQFFYYAGVLKRERRAESIVLCAGNTFETTFFKTAFAGVNQKSNRGVLTDTSKFQSLNLLWYYTIGVLRNPRLINLSIWDSIKAFWSSYFLKDEFVYLFNYIEWDEKLIMQTLKNDYGWESAEDTSATWRIGDGTSTFYNYVYYSVAGFTESDTFRSNQIRAGALSRSDALLIVEAENRPRLQALNAYAAKVGVNAESLMQAIHSMSKLWK